MTGIPSPYPREAQKTAAKAIVAARAERLEAKTVVRSTLLACLPSGVPPSFTEIVSARFVGSGRTRTIEATLTMFDGAVASVTLTRWAMGWSHRFTFLPGGAVSFEDGAWRRVHA